MLTNKFVLNPVCEEMLFENQVSGHNCHWILNPFPLSMMFSSIRHVIWEEMSFEEFQDDTWQLFLIYKWNTFNNPDWGAQWLSGRVLDSRPKGRGFEPHRRHCVVVLEQDTFILA